MFVIQAKARNIAGKVGTLRKGGELPAVYYGAGKKSTSISISNAEFLKVWRAAGESSAIVVKAPEGDVDALIHEVQMDPVRDEPIHVDFLAIDMTKKIKVKVPLEFVGVSEAVKSGVGTLVKVLHEIEIEALPKDLPHGLTVDISKLATLQDNIVVSEIKLPAGVVAITPETDVVASVVEQVEEKFEEVAAPVDLSAIEVTDQKGKKEEEVPTEVGIPTEVGSAKEEKAEKKEKK